MKCSKKLLRLTACFLLAAILLSGCQWGQSLGPQMLSLGEDYIFTIENAVGDAHNIWLTCSLKRRDGGQIPQETKFEEFHSAPPSTGVGGSGRYDLSEDGRTLWLTQEYSTSTPIDSETLCTLRLENLTFGEGSDLAPVEGKWTTSYRVNVTESRELVKRKFTLEHPEEFGYNMEFSSIQVSPWGISMELNIPDEDSMRFRELFSLSVTIKEGPTIELEDGHTSIRGTLGSHDFDVYLQTTFPEPIPLDKLNSIVICGYAIPVDLT